MVVCPREGCDRDFEDKGGLRKHHTQVHGFRIPETKTCRACGDEFEVQPSQADKRESPPDLSRNQRMKYYWDYDG